MALIDDSSITIFCLDGAERPARGAAFLNHAVQAITKLAFVSHYGDFPYLMTKLLIPQVSGYQNSPEEYIYNRLLALYCQLHYTGFGRVDRARQGRDAIDWHDEALTKLWSSVNRESAEKYSEALLLLTNPASANLSGIAPAR